MPFKFWNPRSERKKLRGRVSISTITQNIVGLSRLHPEACWRRQQMRTRCPRWMSKRTPAFRSGRVIREDWGVRKEKNLTGKAFIVEIARWWKCAVSWWIWKLEIGPTYMSVRPQACSYYFVSCYYHRNERLEISWFATSHRSAMSAMKMGERSLWN
jgi:hypothetical protein